jgi:hypothetical protein
VRNGLLILLTSTTSSIHARKVLLHVVNLRHGTDGMHKLVIVLIRPIIIS